MYLTLTKFITFCLFFIILGCLDKTSKNVTSLENGEITTEIISNDYVNVNIKREDLKLEIEKFVNELSKENKIDSKIKGITIYILKLTSNDMALKLLYTNPDCSHRLLGIANYRYKELYTYLMSFDGRNSSDFFRINYIVKCKELNDHTIIMNKTHIIPYYEMLRDIPSKILYYEWKNCEFVLSNYYLNDRDIPGYEDYYIKLKNKESVND